MSSVNKVILVGHLGRDPETRFMPSGEAVTNASLATSEQWKDKASGEKKEHTEWHRLSFFGKLAEIAGEYLKKGSLIYVEGRLKTRKWTDKEGQERYTTEIVVDRMQMLGGKKNDDARDKPSEDAKEPAKKPASSSKPGSFDDMDDDIPF